MIKKEEITGLMPSFRYSMAENLLTLLNKVQNISFNPKRNLIFMPGYYSETENPSYGDCIMLSKALKSTLRDKFEGTHAFLMSTQEKDYFFSDIKHYVLLLSETKLLGDFDELESPILEFDKKIYIADPTFGKITSSSEHYTPLTLYGESRRFHREEFFKLGTTDNPTRLPLGFNKDNELVYLELNREMEGLFAFAIQRKGELPNTYKMDKETIEKYVKSDIIIKALFEVTKKPLQTVDTNPEARILLGYI